MTEFENDLPFLNSIIDDNNNVTETSQYITDSINGEKETISSVLNNETPFIYVNENGEEIIFEVKPDEIINNDVPDNNNLYVINDDNDLFKLIDSTTADQVILVENDEKIINEEIINYKCTHCEVIFTIEKFAKHICEYDENKKLIEDDYPLQIEIAEPSCIQQLRKNNIRIRKFLKDELKIDLKNYSSKSDGPHECNMCERKFVHASGLSRHMEKHATDFVTNIGTKSEESAVFKLIIKCLICGRCFSDTNTSFIHLHENHEENDKDVDIDDITDEDEEISNNMLHQIFNPVEYQNTEDVQTENQSETKCYLTAMVLDSILQCEFCDYLFENNLSLFWHESSHDPLRGYECTACCINVPTFKEIITHWQIECADNRDETKKKIDLQKYFVCNVCELKFTSLDQLYDHRYSSFHLFPRVNRALGILQIGCEICGIFHDTAKSLMIHNEERHAKKVKVDSANKLRPYLCEICGKSYTQSSHLWQHLRFHRGVKPFACKEEGCTRRFTIRPDLNDHIRKCHTGERPYHCVKCGKRFLTGSVFYQHRLIHRGERRYGCEECGRRFYRADALKNHQRIHSGEKPFACDFCPKSFRQRGDRDKHIRARHSTEANKIQNKKQKKNVVFVGPLSFPTSMFQPLIKDIDAL